MKFKNLIILLFAIISCNLFSQNNKYVYIVDDKFMLECDEYFPIAINYMMNTIEGVSGEYIEPHRQYYNDNVFCDNENDCYETMEAQLAMIKHMGFNVVRVVGFEVSTDGSSGNLLRKLNGSSNHVVLSPNQFDDHFDHIEKFINLAWDSVGLRVILYAGAGGVEHQSVTAIYNSYLRQLATRFADEPGLLAYDLYNEPYYFDAGNYTKNQVYNFVKNWYDTIRYYAPNQLITIGLTYPSTVYEWDPVAMSVDFISYHPYCIKESLDVVRGYIKWYSEVTEKPWIIGETGYSGTDITPLPSEAEGTELDQKAYADSTLKMTRDCGGKGYSWWHYQDVDWALNGVRFVENHQGLLNRRYYTGTFPSSTFQLDFNNKWYTVDGETKDAADVFDSDDFDPFDYGTCPSETSINYYNPNSYTSLQAKGYVKNINQNPIANALIMGKRIENGSAKFYSTYTNNLGYYELYTDNPYPKYLHELHISYPGYSHDISLNAQHDYLINHTCILYTESIPTLKDVYDYGLSIPAGSTVNWSNPKLIYKELILGANSTLILNTSLFLSETANIILEPGATLILEDGSHLTAMCPDDKWEGLLHVKENAELMVKGGATINMGGDGHILIDYANGAAGKLRFFNEGNIILGDYATKLEIKGDLHLMSLAQFGTSGNGYVLFNSPLADNLCYNIIAASNTSMDFTGTSTNHKKLEIAQPSLYMHGVNGVNAVKYISFANCKVVMSGSNSRMSLYRANNGSIYLNNVTITSSTGNRTGHRGIALYGQTNITIQNSVFNNGLYGIHAMLNYTDGAPLILTNCTFTNNTRGLNVNDKGITLNSCYFTNNDYGVYADGMTFLSNANSSTFTYNTNNALHYNSASTGGLYVYYSTLTNNSSSGVWFSGTTKLSVLCGQINNNQRGIYFTGNASLNMSQNENPQGGKVNMSVNTNNNIDVLNGNLLFLNNGYNNLQCNTNKKVINGNLGGYTNCPTYLGAQRNRWNVTNTSPVYNTDYTLINNERCLQNQIYLSDGRPTYTGCSQQMSMPFISGTDPYSGASLINTLNYTNTYLSDAIANIVTLNEDADYYLSFAMLNEVLNYPLFSTSAADNYYLNKAYLYMKQNMAYILQDLLSDTSLTTQNTLQSYVGQLRHIQNNIIAQTQNDTNAYNRYYYASLDKALLYRAIYDYDNALLHLHNIMTWVKPANADELNKWICLTQLEKDVLDSIVRKEDFFELKQLCEYNVQLKMVSDGNNEILVNEESEPVIQNLNIDEPYITVTPNPVTNQSLINVYVPNFKDDATIRIFDVLGTLHKEIKITEIQSSIRISNTSFKDGIYQFVLMQGNTVLDNVRVVFIKN